MPEGNFGSGPNHIGNVSLVSNTALWFESVENKLSLKVSHGFYDKHSDKFSLELYVIYSVTIMRAERRQRKE